MAKPDVQIRRDVRPGDPQTVRAIVESSGYFFAYEIDVAVELVEERLSKGEASGYHFVFAESAGQTAGYACFGPIPCTDGSFDLYWIAVHESFRGQGLGKVILQAAEAAIKAMGGRNVYIETASKEQYQSTRGFYLAAGYALEAVLKDFYAPGDDKHVYSRRLP
jgi:ribosomal protein S18 acetylase RimI-like enzyme